MKNKTFLLSLSVAGLTLFLSCSHKQNRFIASGAELVEVEKSLQVFSGPGTAAEQIIASSLKDLPLKVEIVEGNVPEIHCRKGKDEGVQFELEGKAALVETVVCSLDHNGSEYPRSVSIKVRYSFNLADYVLPNDLENTKASLKEYLEVVKGAKEWSADMRSFVDSVTTVEVKTFDASSSSPVKMSAGDGGFYFDLQKTESAIKLKKLFGAKDFALTGVASGKAKKLIYPEFKHGALVCGTGMAENKISKVLVGSGEIFSLVKADAGVYCQFNHYKGKAKLKLKGSYSVSVKEISYSKLEALLNDALVNEDGAIQTKINNLYSAQKSQLQIILSEILKSNSKMQSDMTTTMNSINRNKFLAQKNEIISKLFPLEVKEKIGKVGSFFYMSPVKKKVFQANGKIEEQLYLLITNEVAYRTEGSFKSVSFIRDTSLVDGVNISLQTADAYSKDTDRETVFICQDQMNRFGDTLEKIYSGSKLSFKQISERFAGAKGDVANCKVTELEKEPIIFTKGAGYYIFWKKLSGDESSAVMKGELVGADYSGKIFDQDYNLQLERDRKYHHPVFSKDFTKEVGLKNWKNEYLPDRDLYMIKYDDEKFITME
ncbi:MAG: hypothetical protein ACOYL6_08560 [Bacteriovoracaceae bacterium]